MALSYRGGVVVARYDYTVYSVSNIQHAYTHMHTHTYTLTRTCRLTFTTAATTTLDTTTAAAAAAAANKSTTTTTATTSSSVHFWSLPTKPACADVERLSAETHAPAERILVEWWWWCPGYQRHPAGQTASATAAAAAAAAADPRGAAATGGGRRGCRGSPAKFRRVPNPPLPEQLPQFPAVADQPEPAPPPSPAAVFCPESECDKRPDSSAHLTHPLRDSSPRDPAAEPAATRERDACAAFYTAREAGPLHPARRTAPSLPAGYMSSNNVATVHHHHHHCRYCYYYRRCENYINSEILSAVSLCLCLVDVSPSLYSVVHSLSVCVC